MHKCGRRKWNWSLNCNNVYNSFGNNFTIWLTWGFATNLTESMTTFLLFRLALLIFFVHSKIWTIHPVILMLLLPTRIVDKTMTIRPLGWNIPKLFPPQKITKTRSYTHLSWSSSDQEFHHLQPTLLCLTGKIQVYPFWFVWTGYCGAEANTNGLHW